MKNIDVLTSLLRNREAFVERSLTERLKRKEILVLLGTCLLGYVIYGAIIGLSHGWQQSAVSAIKLPILFMLTSLICFPTLYFFLSILGVKQSGSQLVSFMLICLVFISICLLAFAPISVFFLITSNSYSFFKLVNVLIFAIAGFIGLYTFYKYLIKSWRLSRILLVKVGQNYL